MQSASRHVARFDDESECARGVERATEMQKKKRTRQGRGVVRAAHHNTNGTDTGRRQHRLSPCWFDRLRGTGVRLTVGSRACIASKGIRKVYRMGSVVV